LLRHEHRSVTVAHARAAGQKRILIAHMGVGVKADGRNVELATRGPFVERLDILQDVLKTEAARRYQSLRQSVKHEGIVRIGRMAERQLPGAWHARNVALAAWMSSAAFSGSEIPIQARW